MLPVSRVTTLRSYPSLQTLDAGTSLIVLRLFGIAVIAALCFTLPSRTVTTLFIVAGQGHFLAAYLYKLRYKHISRRGFLLWLAIANGLFIGFALVPNIPLWGLVTTMYFLYHFATDENYLAGRNPTLTTALEFFPLLIIFFGLYLETQLAIHRLQPILSVGLVALGSFAYAAYRTRHRFTPTTYVFLAATLTLIGFGFGGKTIPFTAILGTVILYHYFNWYLTLFVRFLGQRERMQEYVTIVGQANGLILGLYLLTIMAGDPAGQPARYLFGLEYFYLWTILHLVASMRRRDLGYLTQLD